MEPDVSFKIHFCKPSGAPKRIFYNQQVSAALKPPATFVAVPIRTGDILGVLQATHPQKRLSGGTVVKDVNKSKSWERVKPARVEKLDFSHNSLVFPDTFRTMLLKNRIMWSDHF